ncbi:unnamed protein product [Tenebrio molitor]|nr:unnamed protein product [Tenebrio molitor]
MLLEWSSPADHINSQIKKQLINITYRYKKYYQLFVGMVIIYKKFDKVHGQ